MKSYEVIRQAVDEPGVKAVAAALKVSPALVYKWCEPPADNEDPEQSGAKNPLDRVREMYLLTKDIRLIRWLCNEAGGFFVSNPVPELRQQLGRDHLRRNPRHGSRLLRTARRGHRVSGQRPQASTPTKPTRSARSGKTSRPASSDSSSPAKKAFIR